MPDTTRFFVGVFRLLRRRVATSPVDATAPPAVFFLNPEPPTTLREDEVVDVPMLDSGTTSVEGSLWFVGPAVRSGYGVSIGDMGDAALFVKVVTELSLGSVPAILFDPRSKQPALRYYPRGLGDRDNVEVLDLVDRPLTPSDIFAVIDGVHLRALVRPGRIDQRFKLWQEPSKHWVAKDAEATIEYHVKVGLYGRFPQCDVRTQQDQATGRLDLEVAEGGTGYVLLELKVLRTFGSTGNSYSNSQVDNIVAEGVRQAAVYRDERGTRASALCCFDMRKTFEHDCLTPVRGRAKRLRVIIKVWPLFTTAGAYREVYERGLLSAGG